MSKSYIPEGTCVVCTSMTVSSPLKLVHIHQGRTYYGSNKKALLNYADRKISESFVCKNAQKFWGGLGAMLMGIAVGLVIGAAIVATAGTAAIVIAAIAVSTAAVGAGVMIGGAIVAANDCDVIQSTDWKLFHKSVYIDERNALLQSSILSCSKGGVVSIVPDPIKAQKYASTYADNNNSEVTTQMWSQGLEGVISGITFLGSPFAAGAGIGLGTYFYAKNESEGLEKQQKIIEGQSVPPSTFGGDVKNQLEQEKYNQGSGAAIATAETTHEIITKEVIPVNQGLNVQVQNLGTQAATLEAESAQLAARGLNEQAAEVAARAANARLAQDIAARSYRMPWSPAAFAKPGVKFLKGLGVGVLGAVVNFGIEQGVNGMEDDDFANVVNQYKFLSKENASDKQGINVVALKS